MITLQQIFNKAWNHFIVNNELPATNDVGLAKYLDGGGRRCAIGLAIPDDHPALKSGKKFSYLVRNYPALFSKSIRMMDSKALDSLQRNLHDDLCEPGYANTWKYDLETRERIYRNVAKQYYFRIPKAVAV